MFRFLYSLLFIVFAGLIVILHWLPEDAAHRILREDGIVENLSALGWFLTSFIILLVAFRHKWTSGVFGSVIVLLAGLRELDFQKRFTTMSVSKIKFFHSPEVPLAEKVVVSILFAAILYMLYRFIADNWSTFKRNVQRRHAPSLAILAVLVILPISKVLDRLPNALVEWGIIVQWQWMESVPIFEEVVECAIPFLLLTALFHYLRDREVCPDEQACGAGPENPERL